MNTTPSRPNLLTRFVIGIIILTTLTALTAGAAASWVISRELRQQVWHRAYEAQRYVDALLNGELLQLDNLASLASQRPTVQRLLQAQDTTALGNYLAVFQNSAHVDYLHVEDVAGEISAGVMPDAVEVSKPAFYPLNGDQVALLAQQPIVDPETGMPMGIITVGKLIDTSFVTRYAEEADFAVSLIVGGTRAASSLAGMANTSTAGAYESPSDAPRTAEITVDGLPFYSVLIPLRDLAGREIGAIEVAVSVSDLVLTEQHTVIVLIAIMIGVAVVSSLVGAAYARRLMTPLQRLTQAASTMSNLAQPISIQSTVPELITLADALETSRIHLRDTLADLQQAKAWSDSIIQSVVEGVVTYDQDTIITFFSQGAQQIMQWENAQALGQPLNTVFQAVGGDFAENVSMANATRIKVRNQRGDEITLAVTRARLQLEGEAQSALVFRDITGEVASRNLQTYFLANISHEFRTPLSALKASIELLVAEMHLMSEAEIRELLNSIHLSVSSLQNLVNNLLESTKIEAGHFVMQRKLIQMSQVLAEAIQIMQPLLDRRKQTLTIRVPLAATPLNADPVRLVQVMVNLLSNASNYSAIGATVDVQVEPSSDHLRIVVADTGIGIPADQRTNVFHRFVRLESARSEVYGMGLGLSVVKAIVDSHGGTVGVDEREGGGAMFWFTLPKAGEPA